MAKMNYRVLAFQTAGGTYVEAVVDDLGVSRMRVPAGDCMRVAEVLIREAFGQADQDQFDIYRATILRIANEVK